MRLLRAIDRFITRTVAEHREYCELNGQEYP
jgi:hypothetical protein